MKRAGRPKLSFDELSDEAEEGTFSFGPFQVKGCRPSVCHTTLDYRIIIVITCNHSHRSTKLGEYSRCWSNAYCEACSLECVFFEFLCFFFSLVFWDSCTARYVTVYMINVWFLPVFRLPWSSLVWLIFGQHPSWISWEFSMLCHHEPGGLNWFSWKENQSPNFHEFSAVFHSCQKASRCYADGIGILVASCYNLLCCLLFLLGHCVKSEQRPRQRGAGNSGNLLYWSLLSPNFYWPSVVLRCFERRCSFVSQKVCQKVCILACNCLQVSGMFPSLQQEIFSQTLGSGGTLRCKIGAQLLVSICSLVPLYSGSRSLPWPRPALRSQRWEAWQTLQGIETHHLPLMERTQMRWRDTCGISDCGGGRLILPRWSMRWRCSVSWRVQLGLLRMKSR